MPLTNSDLVTLIVTFDGNWQNLNLNAAMAVDAQRTTKCCQISFQPDNANANSCFIAGVDRAGTVPTTTQYGVELPAASVGVPPAPYMMGEGANRTLELEKIYVKGTNLQKLRINIWVVP